MLYNSSADCLMKELTNVEKRFLYVLELSYLAIIHDVG